MARNPFPLRKLLIWPFGEVTVNDVTNRIKQTTKFDILLNATMTTLQKYSQGVYCCF